VPLRAAIDLDSKESGDGIWSAYKSSAEHFLYEVLLRYKGQDGRLVCPDAFLPTAERFEYMVQIDRWVIENAFAELSKTGPANSDIKLTLNLSAQTLAADDAASYIDDRLHHYNVNPHNIIFEITETRAVTNMEATKKFIRELHGKGCRFALDDFGSGFSSFSHLKYLDVDLIKIDGMFAQGIISDPANKAVIRAISRIARALKKQTVIEYVENKEILNKLRKTRIDYIQGYYVSKPLSSL
jgi:EAL domain-containing protein (putative c-di-GMP-specific phosphodiesterase class I)